ncbi:aminoglycoside phosphotransferase family protein [Paenibacillus guangzhouensis]|uniref:hypothetical protein n=1 Tax=Paenibacillus guangzhouensis TaxID=1473112 RepID=UPI001266A7F2|nr:hypothetical protein [Paenibacillus guangzhouensis]
MKSLLERIVSLRALRLVSWDLQPLGKAKEESSVFRVSCSVQDDNHVGIRKNLILKTLKPDATRNRIDHYYYWKREALVYRSGMLRQLPPVIHAPDCYAVDEHVDGSVWIWLEDVDVDPMTSDWDLDRMRRIAYLLGRFNGDDVHATRLSNADLGLCRQWMRSWIAVCMAYAQPVQEQRMRWERHVQQQAMWERYILHRSRINDLLDTLDLLPRGLAHQDAHWDNIFLVQRNGHEALLAMDWQFASISGVGEELGRLFGYALLKKKIPIEQVEDYKETLFVSYLQGLQASGWVGDPKLARFGFTATAALRFVMVIDKLLERLEAGAIANQVDEHRHLLQVAEILLTMADETWSLRDEIVNRNESIIGME